MTATDAVRSFSDLLNRVADGGDRDNAKRRVRHRDLAGQSKADICRQVPGVGPAVEGAIGEEERAISVITVSELLHGVHRASGAQRTRRGVFVEHLLSGLRAIEITTGNPREFRRVPGLRLIELPA